MNQSAADLANIQDQVSLLQDDDVALELDYANLYQTEGQTKAAIFNLSVNANDLESKFRSAY